MTPFEQYFLNTMKFYKERKVPIFLHGSTLLRIIRDKTVEPRPKVDHDREVNIGILAEDFADNLFAEMHKTYPFFSTINDMMPNSLIYYSSIPLNTDGMHTLWDIRPGITLLARFFETKNYRLEYMGGQKAMVYPKDIYGDKNNRSQVEILGEKYPAPPDIHRYLSYHFGEDYMIENPTWEWGDNSKHRCFMPELLEEGELC